MLLHVESMETISRDIRNKCGGIPTSLLTTCKALSLFEQTDAHPLPACSKTNVAALSYSSLQIDRPELTNAHMCAFI